MNEKPFVRRKSNSWAGNKTMNSIRQSSRKIAEKLKLRLAETGKCVLK